MMANWIRLSGLAAMVGGVLWAVTPLREPVFGGGGLPGDAAFRPYNFVIIVIAILLATGLLGLHARYKRSYGRPGTVGAVVIFAGYALLLLGSIPAILFSADGPMGLIKAGQDLGFFGAVISAFGAIFLGSTLWRARATPRFGSLLLIIALPVGIIGVILVSAAGLDDIAGLPLTVLYGGAWLILGYHLQSGAGEAATSEIPSLRN